MSIVRNTKITAIGSVDNQGIDSSTQALTTVNYEHHEVHGGAHYNIRGFDTVASGAALTFGFTTTTGSKWAHLVFEVTGTSQTEVRGWEGATLSGGVAVTPFNNNRNSSNTCTCTIVANPVISGASPTSGTLIEAHSQGKGGITPAKADFGSVADREDEWVLKSGTTYMWELKSVDDNNIIDYAARFYEHTDKVQKF